MGGLWSWERIQYIFCQSGVEVGVKLGAVNLDITLQDKLILREPWRSMNCPLRTSNYKQWHYVNWREMDTEKTPRLITP